MSGPLLSVIVPTYNGEAYVAEAVASALGQTWPDLEVIVVNDGSTDGTRAILAAYEPRITVIDQPNLGVSAARNAGLARAGGELVAWLDHDDRWLPEKAARQVALFADPRVGLVHTDVIWYDERAGKNVSTIQPHARPDAMVGQCFDRLLMGNPIVNSTVMVRRAALEEVGGVNQAMKGNSCQDYDLWLRLARRWRFAYVPEPLLIYRLHPGQGLWNRRRMLADELDLLARMIAAYRIPCTSALEARIARVHEELGVAHLDAGDPGAARGEFLRALRRHATLRRAALCAASLLPCWAIRVLRRAKARLPW